jgi:uridine kinase
MGAMSPPYGPPRPRGRPPAGPTGWTALVERIHALDPSCGPVRVVAVDGPSAAGKSTFARRLGIALGGVPVVHADDFPVPWDGHPQAWLPPLTAHVLNPLRAGRSGMFRRYDWRRGRYTDEIEVPAAPVLVIEGVGAVGVPHGLLIWVDAPDDLRRRRAVARGDDMRDWERWAVAEAGHFAAERTRARADLVIDGTDPA